jgi:glycosyltransferase involved in cell wall biosynthesis
MDRICMVVQSYYPADGRVRREAEALAREDIRTDVVCLRGEAEPDFEQHGLVNVYRVMEPSPKDNLGRYLWMSTKFATIAFFKLQALALRNRYKVIQVHNMPDFLVFAGLFQRVAGTPVVLDLHDLSVELFQTKLDGSKARALLPLVRGMEKVSTSFASRLITASGGFERRLIERGVPKDKITVVLNTADPHIFQLQSDRTFERISERARLLYHGTIQPRFGMTKAIEAMAKVQDRIPDTTLRIYGRCEPEYRRELDARILELGLRERVLFPGFVGLEDITEAIRESDLGLVPYESDEFMNLALSTKAFEYATTGLPVVASRLDSMESIFDDECISYADPNSSDDLADKIVEMCLNPELRRSRATKAAQQISQISGAVMAERYVGLMRGLMGTKGQ